MDNLLYPLIFYVLGAVVSTMYGFMAKIITSDNSALQFDAKYCATLVMSIIVSFMDAIGTFVWLFLRVLNRLLFSDGVSSGLCFERCYVSGHRAGLGSSI
jgi:uncharacterized membrane protein